MQQELYTVNLKINKDLLLALLGMVVLLRCIGAMKQKVSSMVKLFEEGICYRQFLTMCKIAGMMN